MDVPSQYAPSLTNDYILSSQRPEKNGVQGVEVEAETVRITCAPNIERWLDDAGLNPYEFRLLARISRRAGRHGSAFESVGGMAQGCGMNERTAQRYLPKLIDAGYVCVRHPATPKKPTKYALAPKMHVGDKELVAIFVPAWLDDLRLSPQAFRLIYHLISCNFGGEVRANYSRAARTCGISRPKVLDFESELVTQGLLEHQEQSGNRSVFKVACLPEGDTGAELSTSVTPTVNLSHPKVFF